MQTTTVESTVSRILFMASTENPPQDTNENSPEAQKQIEGESGSPSHGATVSHGDTISHGDTVSHGDTLTPAQ